MIGKQCSVHLQEESCGEKDQRMALQCPQQPLTDPVLGQLAIDMLPDDALLEIFDFYLFSSPAERSEWHTLVHVCRRWRHLVFSSPRRLHLRLEYNGKRPITEMLHVWPRLPIAIAQRRWDIWDHDSGNSHAWNMVEVLDSEYYDRICEIDLFDIPNCHLERIASAMQKPFPELTDLHLDFDYNAKHILPVAFLGGSAPQLRKLDLNRTPFPTIKKLLLSSNNLVTLRLWHVSDSGYISPETMVTCLSVMPKLNQLELGFQLPQSSPPQPSPDFASRYPPTVTRSVLPALTSFSFRGVCEYLEDIVARIDATLLQNFRIELLPLGFAVDLPQLHQFISRTEGLKNLYRATVVFSQCNFKITLAQGTLEIGSSELSIIIWRRPFELLPSIAQVCRSSLPPIPTLEHLKIDNGDPPPHWIDETESTQWLQFLDPFVSVKNLDLPQKAALHVWNAGDRQNLAVGGPTEVLPALQNLFIRDLEPLGPVQKAIHGFVTARQFFGHPVAVNKSKR